MVALNPALGGLFRDYERSHRHPVNVRLHQVAIPLIVFHLVAMLDWVGLFRIPGTALHVTLAHVAYVAVIGWYLSLDAGLAVWMAGLFAVCFPIGWVAPRLAVVCVAVVAWTLQLAGHSVWERQRPAFLHNLLHALVGPLFFVAKALGRWPERVGAR